MNYIKESCIHSFGNKTLFIVTRVILNKFSLFEFGFFCMNCNCLQHNLLIKFIQIEGDFSVSDKFYNLFIDVKPLDEIFKDAIVVVDTNVLLMAYQWRDTTFKAVYEVLIELVEEDRLKIPDQVIKEFANKRPEVLRHLSNDIHDKILSLLEKGNSRHSSLNKVIPSLDFFENKDKLYEAEQNYNKALEDLTSAQKEYKKTISDLLGNINNYIDKDPILEQYKTIFERAALDALAYNEQEFKEELNRRKNGKIPPGYLDKGHMGDLKIWKEILELSDKNVILITRDNKKDWVYTDKHDNVIGARRELVEEFYNLNQKTFKILTPSTFIELHTESKGHPMDLDVKEDIKRTPIKFDDILFTKGNKKLSEILGLDTPGKQKIILNYQLHMLENRLHEYFDLVGQEDLIPNEYDDFYNEFESAKELKETDPYLAKEKYDELIYRLKAIIDDVFGD